MTLLRRKNSFLSLALALSVLVAFGFRFWTKSELPFSREPLTDLAPHPGDSSKLLASSKGGLYLRDQDQRWKKILSLQGAPAEFKQLVTDLRLPDKVFLVAQEGVLEGNLKSGRSLWIFRETNPSKNRVHRLTLHPLNPLLFYLGTEQGLFRSHDGGRTWKGPHRWPENQRIELVGFHSVPPRTFLLGTERELFFSKDGGESFESGFSLPFDSEEDGEDADGTSEIPPPSLRFTSLAFSSENPSQLWVGTQTGVYESRDGGVEWVKLPASGLEDLKIRDLVYSDRTGMLITATPRGVYGFRASKKRWEPLPIENYGSPTSLALQPLAEDEGEKLLVAMENKVFEWVIDPSEILPPKPLFVPLPERIELFRQWIFLEPSVGEIQKRAIRYGNLGNGKIRRWHWGSRLRAMIPRLTFSKDFSMGTNIDIDRGGTNNPDLFIMGPEDVDRGWDLGLTWELGDFLYSSAQTSIDSRVKSLVELRESILSEVTRIYFERRRVQTEIAFASPQMSFEEKLDLFLRLDELTAQLDALTDGFLSEWLEEIHQNYPELNPLFSLDERKTT